MAICVEGLKEEFDICDEDSECLNKSCINGRCLTITSSITSSTNTTLTVMFVVLIIFLVITICYVSKVRRELDAYDDRYFRSTETRENQKSRRRSKSGSKDKLETMESFRSRSRKQYSNEDEYDYNQYG